MSDQDCNAKYLKALQDAFKQAQEVRAEEARQQATPDPKALCEAVKGRLEETLQVRCTPDALEMLEKFRAKKAGPANRFHPAWERARFAEKIAEGITKAEEEGLVALKHPLYIQNGECLTGKDKSKRTNAVAKMRKVLVSAMDDPVFAFLKDQTESNAFGEAQLRAKWGTPPIDGKQPQQFDDATTHAAKAVLATGSNAIFHLENYLAHIEQELSEFADVRSSKYETARVFSRWAFDRIAYVEHRTPAADLTFEDVWSSKEGLVTALYDFARKIYDFIDDDNMDQHGNPRSKKRVPGERAKNDFFVRKQIEEDFKKQKMQKPTA